MSPPAGSARRAQAVRLLHFGLGQPNSTSMLRVRGGCMAPLLRDGDLVTFRPSTEPPSVGKIVVAEAEDGTLICHRVLAKTPDGGVLVAGDRGSRLDAITPARTIGIAVSSTRGATRISLNHGVASRVVDLAVAHLRLISCRTASSRSPLVRMLRRAGNGAKRLLLFLRVK